MAGVPKGWAERVAIATKQVKATETKKSKPTTTKKKK